jgi:penicillin-binding protein 1A
MFGKLPRQRSGLMIRIIKVILVLTSLCLFGVLATASGGVYLLWRYGQDLPDYRQLANYQPKTITRFHAGDGRLIAEYATEHRVFVPIQALPRTFVQAFIAAEDKNFYTHPGVDPLALVRATLTNITNIGSNRRLVGASTITQQVAKYFLLSSEISIERKIKEAILSFRIERAFTKDQILELYLNEIYLGYGSYGVAAAALNYFDKSLYELTNGEMAYLAALPKAPNNYHPVRNPKAARVRRNWVISRMYEEGFLDAEAARRARAERLRVVPSTGAALARADYFVEEVRRDLVQRYGEASLYEGGLSVRTTVDPILQRIADETLRRGLIVYDRRHGWRGPLERMEMIANWLGVLRGIKRPPGSDGYELAVVIGLDSEGAEIGLTTARLGRIPLSELKWARAWRGEKGLGPRVKTPSDVLLVGDVILVNPVFEKTKVEDGEDASYPLGSYALHQAPEINGAIVALDPHTGRVLAMSGGRTFEASEFNRATQAWRQPGSAFKPFVYLAALDNGYTPATRILDAPFVLDQGPGLGKWKPANYTRKFYGPSTMRLGIEKSRNLMTVRLAQRIGMPKVAEYAVRFGLVESMPNQLAMALGAGETTLLKMTAAYAMLVNGGRRITPSLIDRIQDRHGRTIFRHDARACDGCQLSGWKGGNTPLLVDTREIVANATSTYQIVTMLEGVVQRGTGRRVRAVGKPLAGKTGTTNDGLDTWFIGFSPDLAVGVFAGFDQPRPLGRNETGSSVAAPIFKDFMAQALRGKPAIPFRIPSGVRHVRINAETGQPARPSDKQVILEAFKIGTEPDGVSVLIDGSGGIATGSDTAGATSVSAGLY